MTKQKNYLMHKLKAISPHLIYKLIAALWSVLFFVLALHIYFSDSEIWLLTVSQQLLHPGHLHSIYYKYSFHLLTYLFSHWAPTELDVYLWARFGWAAIGCVSIFLISQLFVKVYQKPGWLWPLFIFLITSSLYINQGFRIRGDVFCLFLHALYLHVFFCARENGIKKKTWWLLFILISLMALSTPKFILFLICQIVLCLSWARTSPQKKSLTWLVISSTLAPISLGCGLGLLLSALGHNQVVLATSLAGDFYLKSFDPQLVNPLLFSQIDFFHFFKFYKYSQTHAFILTFWLFAFFVFLFKKAANKNNITFPLQLYAALLLLFVLFYNQKLPFFLGPFLTPVLAQAFCFLLNLASTYRPRYLSFILGLLVFASSSNASVNFFYNFFYNTNAFQRKAITKLQTYFEARPNLKAYDIVGLLPRKNKIFIFVGPSEVSYKPKLINEIMDANPDVIFIVYKFKYLEPEFPPLLQQNWVPLEKDVWVKGRFLSKTQTPELFIKTHTIEGKEYWLIPQPKEKFIFDLLTHKSLENMVLHLDQSLRVTHLKTHFLAIPKNHTSLVLTDVEPIGLDLPPSALFRYDTSF